MFVVGARRVGHQMIELRITASAAYGGGLGPADPMLERAVAFAATRTARPAVYIAEDTNVPAGWPCFEQVAVEPDQEGEPVLRFWPLGETSLPVALIEVAQRAERVLLFETKAQQARRTVVLFT